MIDRFKGSAGKRILCEVLMEQILISGNHDLAREIAELGELIEVPADTVLIEQGAQDTDIYLIIAGSFDVIVNGRVVAVRRLGTHVGEMAAVQPTQSRAATVTSKELAVVLKLSEMQFSALAQKYPQLWRNIAKELCRRLEQRNTLVSSVHEKIRVFIMSSVEALPIARVIQAAFEHDPHTITVWTDGVFRASNYPIEALEEQVDASDFAIAIAQPDDLTEVRGESYRTPRDNVIFELGFFMGRLGRKRTILIESRGEEVKLPSDLIGITTLSYKHPENHKDLGSMLGTTCTRIREIIEDLGPLN